MKQINGFLALLNAKNDLPGNGWIFIDSNVDTTNAETLFGSVFYIPESKADEFYGEDNFSTLVEIPIFHGILEVREKNLEKPTIEDYLASLMHYLEFDDFLE